MQSQSRVQRGNEIEIVSWHRFICIVFFISRLSRNDLLLLISIDFSCAVVLLFGMTNTTTVSVKIPERILEQIPPAGQGRSGFILQAIEEKLAMRKPVLWKPKTERGRRMAAMLKKGRAERTPLLSDAQVEQELKERRGRSL
jgi:hypothetical protein